MSKLPDRLDFTPMALRNNDIKAALPADAMESGDSVLEVDGAANTLRWSWACRLRVREFLGPQLIGREAGGAPRAGDLAVVQVVDTGHHERITTRENQRLRIYAGDYLVCVFGNRYATAAYEGLVEDVGNLSLLTAGGMIGTVRSRHSSMRRPTAVRFAGYIGEDDGAVVNLKRLLFRQPGPGAAWGPAAQASNIIAVVGTGMDAGKTTSCVRLIRGLTERGMRVAACKLTGSVSNRDQDEMRAASAVKVLDFSDYGFPSTYLCDRPELLSLFRTMLADIAPSRPDVVVMELADGIVQRETAMLLEDRSVREALRGVVLADENTLSAHFGAQWLRALGHNVLGVTGLLTSSPLYMREFAALSEVPVASSTGSGAALVGAVLGRAAA